MYLRQWEGGWMDKLLCFSGFQLSPQREGMGWKDSGMRISLVFNASSNKSPALNVCDSFLMKTLPVVSGVKGKECHD